MQKRSRAAIAYDQNIEKISKKFLKPLDNSSNLLYINIGCYLVVIGPNGSEFVWIPTARTALERRDFGSYFSGGGSLSGYWDDTGLETYQSMLQSVRQYGGFYMGRHEASRGNDNLPASKGNNWEWTQERYGSGNYVMRGGGYNLMGGACPGNQYPAALRDPLPGNNHHPNVTFRIALHIV